MKPALFILTFIMSVGLSCIGIITAYRLKLNPKYPFASSLFYMSVFFTAFGFYGIWGNLLMNFLFGAVVSSNYLLINMMGVFPIVGIPLLIVAWFLMITLSVEMTSRKVHKFWAIGYFTACVLGLFLIGIHLKNRVSIQSSIEIRLIYDVLVGLHFCSILLASLIILFNRQKLLISNQSKVVIFSLFAPSVLFVLSLFMSHSHWILVILTILFYHSMIAILPSILYFQIGEFEIIKKDFSGFDSFCEMYEISKREAEIINQICQGKTNKEISESLFITLQTVKDHASRIYLKTNVSNRVQLTNLVRTKIKSENV